MLTQSSIASRSPEPRTLLERVRERLEALACERVWTRGAGPHVLLGLRGDEAFARLTPLGAGSYGLAFRALDGNAWEPLLLIDDLDSVVEHALVAVDATP